MERAILRRKIIINLFQTNKTVASRNLWRLKSKVKTTRKVSVKLVSKINLGRRGAQGLGPQRHAKNWKEHNAFSFYYAKTLHEVTLNPALLKYFCSFPIFRSLNLIPYTFNLKRILQVVFYIFSEFIKS